MPLTFDITTRLMVLAAIAIVAVPLLRRSGGRRVWPSAAAAAAFIYLGSAVVYPFLSNWTWTTPSPGAVGQDRVTQLSRQAEATPDEPGVWLALGEALMRAQRPAEAIPALERLRTLTDARNPDHTLLLIDALMMSDSTAAARGRVNRLVENLLVQAPDHPKALFYGAELALARNDLELARTRMAQLLLRADDDPSDEGREVKRVLEQRIAMIDQRFGGGAMDGPTLTVRVAMTVGNAADVPQNTPVFVLATDGAGPPLAVRRLRFSDLPASVTLSDADAMLPSRKLSSVERVEIVARVALGGSPVANSGDLYGAATVDVSRREPIDIAISKITP
ncbi:MAG: hypothetical protein AAF610_03035 [Pseudomonadota bacterium]